MAGMACLNIGNLHVARTLYSARTPKAPAGAGAEAAAKLHTA